MNSQEIWSLIRTLLNVVGGILVTNHLAGASDVAQASTDMMTIGPALVSLCSIGYGVYAHWNMKKVPETAKIIGAVLAAFLIFGSGDASAQIKLTGNPQKDFANIGRPAAPSIPQDNAMEKFGAEIQKIEKTIVDKAVVDVQAAIDDATNHNDQISLPCWQSTLTLLNGLPTQWPTPPKEIGVALGIQIQRDLINQITGTDAKSLKVACAALWGDQLKILLNIGGMIGIRIATGGLAG
jgi:hypothetical protein